MAALVEAARPSASTTVLDAARLAGGAPPRRGRAPRPAPRRPAGRPAGAVSCPSCSAGPPGAASCSRSPTRSTRSSTLMPVDAPRRPAAQRPGIDELLAVEGDGVVCGSGGVGKTTTAAALARMAAVAARRPGAGAHRRPGPPAGQRARPRRVRQRRDAGRPREPFAERRRRRPGGELWVAMLDTKAGWDELIRRHAPDADGARRGPRQPAVPEHHRPVRAQPRLHRHGAAARAARVAVATTSSSSTRRRRATPSTCSTRPGG